MDKWEMNPYYYPENSNLKIVGVVEWREPNYDFDMTVVWQDEQGLFLMDSDTGCSCPSPFEDTDPATLTRMSKFEVAESLLAKQAAAEAEGAEWKYFRAQAEYSAPKVVDVIAKVMKAGV